MPILSGFSYSKMKKVFGRNEVLQCKQKRTGNYYIYFLVHFWSEILDALEKVK